MWENGVPVGVLHSARGGRHRIIRRTVGQVPERVDQVAGRCLRLNRSWVVARSRASIDLAILMGHETLPMLIGLLLPSSWNLGGPRPHGEPLGPEIPVEAGSNIVFRGAAGKGRQAMCWHGSTAHLIAFAQLHLEPPYRIRLLSHLKGIKV